MIEPQKCPGPDCSNFSNTGTDLCPACESRWMRLRDEAVNEAEHLTDLAAQFRAYCLEHGRPDPYVA